MAGQTSHIPQSSIEIYTAPNNSIQLQVKLDQETVWLTQDQMAMLFQRDKSVIARHISNIYAEGELLRESTVAKIAIVPTTRERTVKTITVNLVEKGIIIRRNGKRNGYWEIIKE